LEVLPAPDKPEILKPPETPPFELGFSDLADYEDCGYLYRLGRVFGFQTELVAELGYGNAVHHVLRHVAEEAKETGSMPDAAQLKGLIARELYIPFANESTFANMTRSVSRLVDRYVGEWEDDLNRVWATERPFEIHFEGGILSGRADVILDEEDGKIGHLAIVDYKTSTDEHRDKRYAKQLTIYAAAGRQEGIQVDACYIHALKSSERTEVDVVEAKTAEAVAWAAIRFNEIASGVYPAKPEGDRCGKCDFKLVCRHSCAQD
jgi:DNA helicase-2/ATP-dependent DNA helicase PcrA